MNSPHSCPRRARLPAALTLSLVLLPLALSGCGNKGPLVLPEDAEPAPAVATPVAEPAGTMPADAASTDATPADTPDPPRAHD